MRHSYLLDSDCAESLYFEVARDLPLIDYHNHLNHVDILSGKTYANIAQMWICCDPYKHRAMRICGVEESKITGPASDKEKFFTWCETVPKLYGGPLFDWSRIEMQELFGISLDVNKANAEAIWEQANARLTEPGFSAGGLYDRFPMEYCAPCTDITESLALYDPSKGLVPSLRGDTLLIPGDSVLQYLQAHANLPIHSLEDYMQAICCRLQDFQEKGCRFSDHSLDNGFRYRNDPAAAEKIFQKHLNHTPLSEEDRMVLQSQVLTRLGHEYARRGWTLQLHLGAQRVTSTRLRTHSGPWGGYAGIGNAVDIQTLVSLLDSLEQGPWGLPPKVIVYNLNPVDNAALATLSGSFIGVTQGPAWWWCDHIQGIRNMLENFSSFSVLSTFVGMNTDSRSLLSLVRHDYFRRIFCGWIGKKVEQKELPYDPELLTALTRAVCYENAKKLI